MKTRLSLIAFSLLIVGLIGCKFTDKQKANWVACKADPACVEMAKHWQAKVEGVSTVAASAIPFPGAAAVPKVLGYIGLGLAMLLGGNALRKKKVEIAPVS